MPQDGKENKADCAYRWTVPSINLQFGPDCQARRRLGSLTSSRVCRILGQADQLVSCPGNGSPNASKKPLLSDAKQNHHALNNHLRRLHRMRTTDVCSSGVLPRERAERRSQSPRMIRRQDPCEPAVLTLQCGMDVAAPRFLSPRAMLRRAFAPRDGVYSCSEPASRRLIV